MADSVPGPGSPTDAGRIHPAARNDPAAIIAAGLGERRNAPRMEVQVACTVYIGSHVQDGVVRDASAGGAMLNGIRGLLAHDLIRIRLAGREDYRFVAEVRAVSLLGVHVAILSAGDQGRWRDAIHNLMTTPPEGPL